MGLGLGPPSGHRSAAPASISAARSLCRPRAPRRQYSTIARRAQQAAGAAGQPWIPSSRRCWRRSARSTGRREALEFQIQRGDGLAVGDQADLDDPAVVDDEVEDREPPPAGRPDEPGSPGDGRPLRGLGAAEEGLGDGPPPMEGASRATPLAPGMTRRSPANLSCAVRPAAARPANSARRGAGAPRP